MKEHPILFSSAMVRAILDGRKTQTRRVVKKQPHGAGAWVQQLAHWMFPHICPYIKIQCPYGEVGDRLYVRESARVLEVRGGSREITIEYQADKTVAAVKYPARLSPAPLGKRLANGTYREACRIVLEITGVRVERLQAITRDDAKAEGITEHLTEFLPGAYTEEAKDLWRNRTSVENFSYLWESINGPGSWDADPWVWVVEFKRVTGE